MSGENQEYNKKANEQLSIEGQRKQVKVASYPEITVLK